LFVNSPAPELTDKVKPKGRFKVKDRIRVEVRVRVRVGVSASVSLNRLKDRQTDRPCHPSSATEVGYSNWSNRTLYKTTKFSVKYIPIKMLQCYILRQAKSINCAKAQ